ncbi:FHA domain-containing protein [Corynebacterium mustelae]|uniref:FHA domain-containing protein n=1 Tax=Corynebacterium mustelae TaxID=571915 RepID=A0A0G3GV65_9CORY|nr:FHA domain-containing protein [Corynebacterium mustelae]AKK04410.1 FHA domain-containing protein [Corynebacterium mustelae]
MDSAILLGLRIGLLVLLWFFIFIALNAMRKDVSLSTTAAASAGGSAVPPPAAIGGAPKQMTIVDGPMTGSRMDLGALTEITIGRAPDCDFVVADDFASGRHARLMKRGSEWFVEDLDSRNGTFVQGQRIDSPERVSGGSDIKVGRTIVRLVG